MSTAATVTDALDEALQLDPQVALRDEPFGAMAYHYGNRRLVFLRHADIVAVVGALADHPTLRATLQACAIEERRWPSFVRAIAALKASEVVHEQ